MAYERAVAPNLTENKTALVDVSDNPEIDLKTDVYADFAIKQCLQFGVEDATKYIIAVDNVESCLGKKLDDEYHKNSDLMTALEAIKKAASEDIRNTRMLELARVKFRLLMLAIDRKSVKEQTIQGT